MSSFFPWQGGKSKMVNRLCRLLPQHICYVEVFAGAANLLFAKPPSKVEVLNDINSELTTLFKVVRHHPREFIRELELFLHSRTDYQDYRSQRGLTDIQKAARSWFIMKTCFGGKGGTTHPAFGYGTTGKSHLGRSSFGMVRKCHRRLDGVYVENLDFEDCIRRYDRPHTFFYCDPPYLEASDYIADFGLSHHQRLAAMLRKIKGKFLLSINDHKAIRGLYKGLNLRTITTRYTISRDVAAKVRTRTELLISNYRLPK